MLGGAEIILTPNACVIDDERCGQFRARAFENMVGVAIGDLRRAGAERRGGLQRALDRVRQPLLRPGRPPMRAQAR
jgi:predicted amidohydrolase